MERRPRQRATLRALRREVWGGSYDEEHARRRARRRQRMGATAITAVGGQLLLTALGLVLLSTAASAHTSTINIACAQVEFVYRNFPNVTATAHESVVIDRVETAQRDITFHGPGTTDTITISLGPGTHTVAASDEWAYNGRPQGSARASQRLSYCNTSSTTTTSSGSTSSSSSSSTSTSRPGSTTTVPESTTSTAPASSSTTVPESTTSVPESTTSTVPASSSTVPDTSTSTAPTSTSTTAPTSSTTGGSTSTTFHELGSTTTTIGSTSSTTSSHGRMPFTGSSGLSLAAALGALGVGILTLGLTRLRKVNERS